MFTESSNAICYRICPTTILHVSLTFLIYLKRKLLIRALRCLFMPENDLPHYVQNYYILFLWKLVSDIESIQRLLTIVFFLIHKYFLRTSWALRSMHIFTQSSIHEKEEDYTYIKRTKCLRKAHPILWMMDRWDEKRQIAELFVLNRGESTDLLDDGTWNSLNPSICNDSLSLLCIIIETTLSPWVRSLSLWNLLRISLSVHLKFYHW